MSKKPYTSLTFEKRQIIENMAKKKQTPQRIAEATGVHVATIYREMKRGQTKDGYSAIKTTLFINITINSTGRKRSSAGKAKEPPAYMWKLAAAPG